MPPAISEAQEGVRAADHLPEASAGDLGWWCGRVPHGYLFLYHNLPPLGSDPVYSTGEMHESAVSIFMPLSDAEVFRRVARKFLDRIEAMREEDRLSTTMEDAIRHAATVCWDGRARVRVGACHWFL